MSAQELIGILEAQVQESDSAAQEVSEQRSTNHANYTLQPLGNEQPGRSRYISPDVHDSVEAKKAIFTETFFSGRQPAKFVPGGMVSKDEADARTAYCTATFRRNRFYELFRDGWHDAFVAKRMVVYAPWKHDHEEIEVEIEQPVPPAQAMMLVEQQLGTDTALDFDTSGIQQSVGPQGPMVQGTVIAYVDRSHVDLELVQPECFFRDTTTAYVQDGMYAGFERDRTRGRLIEDGYDPAQVLGLKADYRFRKHNEHTARTAHDSSGLHVQNQRRATEQEVVTEFVTYTWLDRHTVEKAMGPDHQEGAEREQEPDQDEQADEQSYAEARARHMATGIALYKICWSCGEILRYEGGDLAIEEMPHGMPFFEWTEYKISHAEHGMSDADLLDGTQRVQSVLKRLVLDNQQMRNSSRWEAVHGALKNPRDLLDNRIGGVVWTRAPGMVKALEAPELSPLTLAVMQMMKQDSEMRSGVTELSKGMNTDVIKYQNAADMIERLTNASNRRIMKAARDFAETFIVPLMRHVCELARKYDERTYLLAVAGNQVPVTPSKWADDDGECEVKTALTSSAAQQYAQQLLMLHQLVKADPELKQLYGLQEQYNLIDEVYESIGVSDSSRFLMRPDNPNFQKQQQGQQQIQQKLIADQMATSDAMKRKAVAEAALAELLLQLEPAKLKLEMDKYQLDAADKAADNLRADREFEWQQLKDTAEVQLEHDQQRAVAIGNGKKPSANTPTSAN